MNVCSILCFFCWYVVQFHDSASYLIKPKIRKNQKFEKISEHKKVQYNDLDLNRVMDEIASSDATNEHSYSPTRLSFDLNLPIGLYEFVKRGISLDKKLNSSGSTSYEDSGKNLKDDFQFKIADILSAARMFDTNHTYPVLNRNCTECLCKPLCFQNSTDFVKCCCSKAMQQKCEGVDLSYLLPIPGDTTTSKTKAQPKNRQEEKSLLTTIPSTATMCDNANTKCFKSDVARNGRGYRKVEESTLDALRRFQLTHGIFAPNEEEVEKAVEKAKIQVSKVRSKLPVLLKHYNHKSPQENYFDNRKIIKDVGELYKLLPQFKIEKVANDMKTVVNNPYYPDVSLLHQNTAAIKKQLETIKQYDILLANIRAQAQLKLIELADMEAKHRIQETRFKSERKQGLEELKNMEEVLREEIKLAQNLPGATGDWNEFQASSYSNQSDIFNQNVGKYYQPQKDVLLPDNVNRNNKLLQYLEMLFHMNDNCDSNYNELNILSKQDHGNQLDDKLPDRFLLWRKPLERAIRNNQQITSGDSNSSNNTNNSNNTRNKRKCKAVKPTNAKKIVEESSIVSNDYDKAFHNLQNDLLELKDQLLSQTKSKLEPQDNNVLVQIKVSVDVANTTDSSRNFRRDITPISDNNKEGKNKQIFQKIKS